MSTGMTRVGSLQSRGVARLARAPFLDLLVSNQGSWQPFLHGPKTGARKNHVRFTQRVSRV